MQYNLLQSISLLHLSENSYQPALLLLSDSCIERGCEDIWVPQAEGSNVPGGNGRALKTVFVPFTVCAALAPPQLKAPER